MPAPDQRDRPLATDVVDAARTPDRTAVREVYRAAHPFSVAVMERPQQYQANYSLSDIHRLTFLSHRERAAVQDEWHGWHRRFVRLGPRGMCGWMAGAGAAFALWWFAAALSSRATQMFGFAIPPLAFMLAAYVAAVVLIIRLPALLAAVSAPWLAESYMRGYADGMTRGVHRALRITPESEQEMWDELRDAERLDVEWRGVDPGAASAPHQEYR